ncbi:MAG: N-acetyltransferase [Acidimicrobiales bacterium]|nr:N-acetyltransferase [Acidimicrobiales bacterium]
MESPVTIRPATDADAEILGALTERAYRVDGHLADSTSDGYARELRDGAGRIRDAVVLLAEIDGALAGAVALAEPGTPYAETARSGELEVRMLAVAPEARRRGVARSLMAAVEDHARHAGLGRVVLSTGVPMQGAQRLYEDLGFRRAPERDWSPGGFSLLGYVHDLD